MLDFDDLHMESTTHISALCVPAALATGGGARGYLAAAGVMARLGTALGWPHYSAGWHATCTAGAPACAAGAAVALGLGPERIATAIALAIPGAGGCSGLRHRRQVAAGRFRGGRRDPGGGAARRGRAGGLVGAGRGCPWSAGTRARWTWPPAIPGGLAIKIHPCCYALQRPINALAELAGGFDPGSVRRIVLRTPEATVAPLIHHRPGTGLQGKFSLEYAAAAALLDRHPGVASFTDEAVRRPAARRLASRVETELSPGGSWLLDGELAAEVHTDGEVFGVKQQFPPGAPRRPPAPAEQHAKLSDCVAGLDADPSAWTWDGAPEVLACYLPGGGRR